MVTSPCKQAFISQKLKQCKWKFQWHKCITNDSDWFQQTIQILKRLSGPKIRSLYFSCQVILEVQEEHVLFTCGCVIKSYSILLIIIFLSRSFSIHFIAVFSNISRTIFGKLHLKLFESRTFEVRSRQHVCSFVWCYFRCRDKVQETASLTAYVKVFLKGIKIK